MSDATPGTAPATPATSAPPTSAPPSPAIAVGTPPSGSPEGTDPASSATPTNDPWAGLDPDNLKVVQNKGWKSPADAIKSYSELERLNSQRPPVRTRPAEKSGYEFSKPDGVDYSDEFANAYRDWAFDHDLDPTQAKGIHDAFVGWAKTQAQAQQTALNEAIATTKSELTKEWGAEQTPEFARNLDLAVRAAKNLGIFDSLERAGALVKINGVTTAADAKMMSALAKVGNAMFSEDRLFGDISASTNPFDPKTEDLVLQGRLIKEDPQKAKALIYAAKQEGNYAYLLSTIK